VVKEVKSPIHRDLLAVAGKIQFMKKQLFAISILIILAIMISVTLMLVFAGFFSSLVTKPM
jgi:hypothetical protein